MSPAPPYRIDAAFHRAAASDFLRWQLRQPLGIVSVVVIAILLLILAVVLAVGKELELIDWLGIGACAVLVLDFVIQTVLTQRSLRVGYPLGSQVTGSFGDDTLAIHSDGASQELRCSLIKSVQVTQHLLLVKLRGSGAVGLIPRAALSEPEIAALQQSVNHRGSRQGSGSVHPIG